MAASMNATLFDEWNSSTRQYKFVIIARVVLSIITLAIVIVAFFDWFNWMDIDNGIEKLYKSRDILFEIKTSILVFFIFEVLSASVFDNNIVACILLTVWIEKKKIDYNEYMKKPLNKKFKDYVSTEAAYLSANPKDKKKIWSIKIAVSAVLGIAAIVMFSFAASDLSQEMIKCGSIENYKIQWPILKLIIGVVLYFLSSLPSSIKVKKVLSWRQNISQEEQAQA